jgi:hypothetical protein
LIGHLQIPFFLAQWQEYHTHVMNTAVGIIGVTEGHWASIMAILATGIFGPSIWETRVGPFNFREVWCHASNAEVICSSLAHAHILSFPIGPSEGH